MYIDFAINETGDLIFEESSRFPLKLSFNYSKYKGQKISFYTRKNSDIEKDNRTLKISFDINSRKNEVAMILKKSYAELGQFIFIQLKDVLGEIKNDEEDGSRLEIFRHENINDETLDAMKIYLENFLSSIISNPTVELTPIIEYKNQYKQTVQIKIYSGNNLLLEYNIER